MLRGCGHITKIQSIKEISRDWCIGKGATGFVRVRCGVTLLHSSRHSGVTPHLNISSCIGACVVKTLLTPKNKNMIKWNPVDMLCQDTRWWSPPSCKLFLTSLSVLRWKLSRYCQTNIILLTVYSSASYYTMTHSLDLVYYTDGTWTLNPFKMNK